MENQCVGVPRASVIHVLCCLLIVGLLLPTCPVTVIAQGLVRQAGDQVTQGAKAQNIGALAALKDKRMQDAEQGFLRTCRNYPNTPEAAEAAYFLGTITGKQDRFVEARDYLQNYVESNPGKGDVARWQYILLRAMSETRDPNFIPAAHAFLLQRHDASGETGVLIRNELIRYNAAREDYAQAIAEARTLVGEYPESRYAHLAEGKITDYLILLNDTQGAIDHCNALLGKYPAHTDDAARAQLSLAAIYANNDDFARARIECAKVRVLHPAAAGRVIAAEYQLARIDMTEATEKNDPMLREAALKRLKTFVANHPVDHHVPGALRDIADINMNNGNYREALAAYDRIIAFDPVNAVKGKFHRRSHDLMAYSELALQAHKLKGMLLRVQLNDPAGALKEYEALLDEDPADADANFNKALCLDAMGQRSQARTILTGLSRGSATLNSTAAQVLQSMETGKDGAQ